MSVTDGGAPVHTVLTIDVGVRFGLSGVCGDPAMAEIPAMRIVGAKVGTLVPLFIGVPV